MRNNNEAVIIVVNIKIKKKPACLSISSSTPRKEPNIDEPIRRRRQVSCCWDGWTNGCCWQSSPAPTLDGCPQTGSNPTPYLHTMIPQPPPLHHGGNSGHGAGKHGGGRLRVQTIRGKPLWATGRKIPRRRRKKSGRAAAAWSTRAGGFYAASGSIGCISPRCERERERELGGIHRYSGSCTEPC